MGKIILGIATVRNSQGITGTAKGAVLTDRLLKIVITANNKITAWSTG